MKRPSLTSRTITRAAFGVVIVFVLAQVAWWIIFQDRYIGSVTERTLASWQQNAVSFSRVAARSGDRELIGTILWDHPYLLFDGPGNRFVVDDDAINAFIREQQGFVRMFAFEGPFFVLVVLSGLFIIARSLRSERELKQRQQNFLSAVTHEFKTPLSTLRLLIETALLRTLPPEKTHDYLQRMAVELARLETTSEHVLAAARLEQAAVAVLEPAELNSVVQGLVGRARPGLEARGADLKVIYSPVPLPVSLDSSAFGVVLNNLLDNAVKYSHAARRPVTVRLEGGDDLVYLHVEDEGVGLSDKERAKIFERFYRVGSEMTRRTQGVGLGLHLVKTITEAMNGWLRVEANMPRGTRFTVVLPRRVALEPREAALQAQKSVGHA